jgi:hypothetical protein
VEAVISFCMVNSLVTGLNRVAKYRTNQHPSR